MTFRFLRRCHSLRAQAIIPRRPWCFANLSGRLVAAVVGFSLLGAAGQRGPAITVRFHGETSALESTFAMPVVINDSSPAQKLFVERVPMISEANIVAFYPFQAADGKAGFGAEFQLDRHGQLALSNVSLAKRGSFLVAMVNGRAVTPLRVDRHIEDGLIVIPHGLTTTEIGALEKSFPRIGQPPGTKPGRRE